MSICKENTRYYIHQCKVKSARRWGVDDIIRLKIALSKQHEYQKQTKYEEKKTLTHTLTLPSKLQLNFHAKWKKEGTASQPVSQPANEYTSKMK